MRTLFLILLWSALLLSPVLISFHEWGWFWFAWTLVILPYLFGTLTPNCSWFSPVVKRFRTDKKEVWLTIDDGPHPEDTPRILSLLATHGARATFFVIGRKAALHPELIQEILSRGHTLGNHTQSHPVSHFWILPTVALAREMDEAEKVIISIAGCSMQKFFRAPVGMVNFFLDPLLKQRGLRLIGWSARGYDAVESNPSQIIKTIWKDISPGAIVLLHEGHHQAGETNAVNPGVLSLLLEQLAQAGYRCVLPNPTDFLT